VKWAAAATAIEGRAGWASSRRRMLCMDTGVGMGIVFVRCYMLVMVLYI
jgi:hypothetical protein